MKIDRLTLDVGAMSHADAQRLAQLVGEALRGWSGVPAERIAATVDSRPDEPVEALAARIAATLTREWAP